MRVTGIQGFTPLERRLLRALWKLRALDRTVSTREVSRATRLKKQKVVEVLGNLRWEVDQHPSGQSFKWKLKNCTAALA